MVVSSDPTWLQGAFTALVGLFDRVGLRKNFGTTVSMVFHPCQAGAGNRKEEAYGRRLTGEGRSYAERQQERVECLEFWRTPGGWVNVKSSDDSTKESGRSTTHMDTQEEVGAQIYRMSFLTKGRTQQCSVEG